MAKTVRQVVAEAVIEWLERADVIDLARQITTLQQLEERTQIWEYGKWCKQDGLHRLGYPQQIKFRGSRPESTAWSALRNMSDDEALSIAEATRILTPIQLEVIHRIYGDWQPINDVRRDMEIGMGALDLLRTSALQDIAAHLQK